MKTLRWPVLVIAFVVIYALALLLLLPNRLVLARLDLPDRIHVQSLGGSIWRGEAQIFIVLTNPGGPDALQFTARWRLCVAARFPFYAACLRMQSATGTVQAKLIGWPRSVLHLASVQGDADLAVLSELAISPAIHTFVKPVGRITFDLDQLRVDLAQNKVLSWRGRVDLSAASVFNLALPSLKAELTAEPFLSRGRTGDTSVLTDADLPTFRLAGNNDKMTLAGEGQLLEDGQVKAHVEFAAQDTSLHGILRSIATGQEGNKFIWDYQGPSLFGTNRSAQT